MAYGFVFILFWFDSHRVSYHSHLDTFHSLGQCFSSFLAHILPVWRFCSVWCEAVSRLRGARKGLISCQSCPCSVTRPGVWMPCINWAPKGPSSPLCWALQTGQESSCPTKLAVMVLEGSIGEYSRTKLGSTRKQSYRWPASTVVMPSDRQL